MSYSILGLQSVSPNWRFNGQTFPDVPLSGQSIVLGNIIIICDSSLSIQSVVIHIAKSNILNSSNVLLTGRVAHFAKATIVNSLHMDVVGFSTSDSHHVGAAFMQTTSSILPGGIVHHFAITQLNTNSFNNFSAYANYSGKTSLNNTSSISPFSSNFCLAFTNSICNSLIKIGNAPYCRIENRININLIPRVFYKAFAIINPTINMDVSGGELKPTQALLKCGSNIEAFGLDFEPGLIKFCVGGVCYLISGGTTAYVITAYDAFNNTYILNNGLVVSANQISETPIEKLPNF